MSSACPHSKTLHSPPVHDLPDIAADTFFDPGEPGPGGGGGGGFEAQRAAGDELVRTCPGRFDAALESVIYLQASLESWDAVLITPVKQPRKSLARCATV